MTTKQMKRVTNNEDEDSPLSISKNISKLAFLFIVFAVIAGGSVTHVLSCQLQHVLETSAYLKHIFGILLIFLFIMMEGGWDFSKKELDKAPVDWANGNTVHSMVYAFIIYAFFIVASKSQLGPNLLLYSIMFIIYFIDSYRNYRVKRNKISKSLDEQIIKFEKTLIGLCGIVLVYGLVDYYIYKKHNLKEKFSLWTFFMYTKKCGYDGVKEINL